MVTQQMFGEMCEQVYFIQFEFELSENSRTKSVMHKSSIDLSLFEFCFILTQV